MSRTVSRLLSSTAAFAIAVLPSQAEENKVFYRATSGTIVYDSSTVPGSVPTVPSPGIVDPLSVETIGSLSVAYGAPVSIRLDPKGGTEAGWSMTYTGVHPARMTIVESGKDVVISSPTGLADGTYGPFSVTLTDGKTTLTKSVSLVVQPASPALAVVSSVGVSKSFDVGAAWAMSFTASGGKGPYTFATTALTGDLAAVTKTVGSTGVSFAGTAPAGNYRIDVDATDAAGKTVRSTVDVIVQVPSAKTLRPVSIAMAHPSLGSISKLDPDQPDWNMLYDGPAGISYVSATYDSYPVGLTFGSAVTFDKVYVKLSSNAAVKIYIKEAGAWKAIKTANATSSGGTIDIGQSYTATEIGITAGSNIYEFRVGEDGAALPPKIKSSSPLVVPPAMNVVATSAMFETRSPYAPGAISLADTPASQNGVTLNVTANSITIATRPTYTTDVMVVAKTPDDGLVAWQKITVQGTSGAVETIRPTSVSLGHPSLVSITRNDPDQPDWNMFYDGIAGANYGSATYDNYPVVLNFATPVTFDRVNVMLGSTNSTAKIYVKEGATWRMVKSQAISGTSGVVVLDRFFSGMEVGISSPAVIHEARVGDGGIALGPKFRSSSPLTVAVETPLVATSAMFETRTPYQAGAINLSETPVSQNGVTLAVTATEVRVATRPVYSTDVMVVARTPDGLAAWQKIRIEGTSGVVETIRPVGMAVAHTSLGSTTKANLDQPDWHVLYDGADASFATVTYDGYPVGVNFATPITFDKVAFKVSTASQVKIYVKEGTTWRQIKSVTAPSGASVVTLDRLYTASDVGISSSSGVVQDFRVGDGGVALPPQIKATSSTTVPVGIDLVATPSKFETRTPYQAGSISLAETPTSQNGVTLSVSANSVTVVNRPAYSTDVMVVARTPDGLAAWQKFRVEGSSGVYEMIRPTSMALAHTSLGTITKPNIDQPDWNVLYDDIDTSYATVNSNGYPVGLGFSTPVMFDRATVKVSAATKAYIYVKEGTTWKQVKSAAVGAGTNTVVLDRAYVASDVGVSTDAGRVYDFRVGDGGIALPPRIKASSITVVAPETALVATPSMFETRTSYQASAISLADTPVSQNGVSLVVSAGEVRVASRPAKTVDVMVVAKTSDGLAVWEKFRIEAVAGQASDTDRPIAVTHVNTSLSSITKAAGQPDWNVFYDNVLTTYGTATYTGYPIGLTFASPITLDKAYVKTSVATTVTIYVKEGTTWKAVKTASVTATAGVVTLDRSYTATEVGISAASGRIEEFRVGDVVPAALP